MSRRRKKAQQPARAAFPGQLARSHKRLWHQADEALNKVRARPATRRAMGALVARVARKPHLIDVMVGYGGVRDRAHREWLQQRREAGLPPPTPGLAELTGMSRSSMIRGARQLVLLGILAVKKGGGRTEGGDGRANEYRLGGLVNTELERLALEARAQADPEQPDYAGARFKLKVITEEWLGSKQRGAGVPGPAGPGPPAPGAD